MRGSTMKHPESLSLESVLDEPLRFDGELEVPVSAIDREPLLALSPLKLTGEVRRIEGGYALDARLVYEGELECSRCLAGYPFREDETFNLVLFPRTAANPEERELSRDDLDAVIYDEPVVKLHPIVAGDGIPLFHGASFRPERYDLTDVQHYRSGVAVLTYDKRG